jgi:hypothetical protein
MQRALVQNLALRSLDFPLTVVNGIAGREGERETCTQQLKAKLERLHSARPTRRDQVVRLLNMQRLHVVKGT